MKTGQALASSGGLSGALGHSAGHAFAESLGEKNPPSCLVPGPGVTEGRGSKAWCES